MDSGRRFLRAVFPPHGAMVKFFGVFWGKPEAVFKDVHALHRKRVARRVFLADEVGQRDTVFVGVAHVASKDSVKG